MLHRFEMKAAVYSSFYSSFGSIAPSVSIS